jgi:hypothetical protein
MSTIIPFFSFPVHRGDILTGLYFIARGSVEIVKDDLVVGIIGG